MEIRRLTKDEFKEADLRWLQSFERGSLRGLDGLPEGRVGFENRITRFGLWDDMGMQATFQMYDSPLRFGADAVLSSTVISSISCAPAVRGRGYGGKGLNYMLKHMKDHGQPLTMLSPFNYEYYRRFGWEWIKVNRGYRVPSRLIPVDSHTEFVREASAEDRPGIVSVYEHYSRRYRGMSIRDDAEWSLVLANRKDQISYVFVYERDHGIEGYLVLRGGSVEETYLPEFISRTSDAQLGLLGLLHRLHVQSSFFSWDAPEDDALWSNFLHREMQTQLTAGLQGRVVDVGAAMRALRPGKEPKGAFIVRVQDAFAPWNSGNWAVQFEGGDVSVSSTAQSAHISMDIQAFSQVFFGAQPIASLRAWGKVEVLEEQGFLAARKLLDGPPMWNNGPL